MGTPVTTQNKIYLLREEVQQLQDRLKAMYAGDLSPESRLNGYKVITNKQKEQIEAQRADKDLMAIQIDEQNEEIKQLKEAAKQALLGWNEFVKTQDGAIKKFYQMLEATEQILKQQDVSKNA